MHDSPLPLKGCINQGNLRRNVRETGFEINSPAVDGGDAIEQLHLLSRFDVAAICCQNSPPYRAQLQ
jgi:hypothetical protein